MFKNLTSIFLFINFISCKNENNTIEEIQKKLDTISNKIEILQNQNNSIKQTTNDSNLKKFNTLQIKSFKEKVPVKVSKPIIKTNQLDDKNDTIVHYFENGEISVKIAPKADRQKIWIYHQNKAISYELENIRLSYSCSNDLFFRKNGSLEKVHVHLNPGASMYMYESIIYFDDLNEPTHKVDTKTPSTLDAYMDNKSLWDSKNRKWVKPN